MNTCVVCKESCKPQIDGYCRGCGARWHFTCTKMNTTGCMHCDSCGSILSDTTIGYWCLYSHQTVGINRNNTPYDVHYIKDGYIVAFMPYIWIEKEEKFQPYRPRVALAIPSPELEKWTMDNWAVVTQALSINTNELSIKKK